MQSELLGIAIVLAVGRLALSWLPPGWPGDHGPRELGATASASLLCGLTLLALQASFLAALGLGGRAAPLLAPWALLLLLRLATLPGAMRPRHEPPSQPADGRTRLILWVGALGLLLPLTLPLTLPFGARPLAGPLLELELGLGAGPAFAHLAALLARAAVAAMVAGGLERGRRAGAQRALVFAVLAWSPPSLALDEPHAGAVLAGLGLAAAGAGALAWLRRADRRALALAWLGLGSAALLAPSGWAPAAAGLGALWWAVAEPARRRVAIGGGAALALGLVGRAASGPLAAPGPELLVMLAPAAFLFLGQIALRQEGKEGAEALP